MARTSRQITAVPSGCWWTWTLTWSADGTRLLYGCANRIRVVDLEGQPVGAVSGLLPAWSADGRRLALYNPGHDRHDDVVLAQHGARRVGRAGVGAGGWRAGVWWLSTQENYLFPGPGGDAGGVVAREWWYWHQRSTRAWWADCEALVALRAELFGRAATNWTTNTPLAAWEGVVVGGTPARVRELVLGDGAIGTFDHGGRLPAGIARVVLPGAAGAVQEWAHGVDPGGRGGALAQLRWLDLSGG